MAIRDLNIKSRTYYFYNDLINIKNFDINKLKLNKKGVLGNYVYYIGLWSNGLVVKALDSQFRGPVFKTAGWLQGRLSLSSSRGR